MKKLLLAFLCKVFGHKWRVVAVCPEGFIIRHNVETATACTELRVCTRCHHSDLTDLDTLMYFGSVKWIGLDDRINRLVSKNFWDLLATLVVSVALAACGSDHSPDAEKKVVSLDLLGIMHEDFPCDKYIEQTKDATEINLGYLANTFGDSRECLNRFVNDERLKRLRVHVTNGACVNWQRCGEYEPLYGLKWDDSAQINRAVIAAMREESRYLKNVPDHTQLFVSGILEYSTSFSQYDVIAERIPEIFGARVIAVANPVYPMSTRHLLEVHGLYETDVFPYGYSVDGYLGIPDDLLEKHTGIASYSFLWLPEFNGTCGTCEFVDPRSRTRW